VAERLETVGWTAEYLNTSPSTVYYLISINALPGVIRLSERTIRIDPGAVREWVAAGGYSVSEELAEVNR
jgi:predicted DNA-binding transcriptional regulator AlpA